VTAHESLSPAASCVPVPAGDNAIVCDHLARRTLALVTAALRDVDMVASVHADIAPASTMHVRGLLAAISGETLDWLRAWPR
jgi:hypothetical protein